MQFPRATQPSTSASPQTPPTFAPQQGSGTFSSDSPCPAVGTGATCESLHSDRQAFAMTVLQTQAASLYEATLRHALYSANPLPLPPLNEMRKLLQGIGTLDHTSKTFADSGALLASISNYLSVAEAIRETTANLVSMQKAYGLDFDDVEPASVLLNYHRTCQNIGWEMLQASLHYGFQAHHLCNHSEDAAATGLKMPLASKQQEDGEPLHDLLVHRQELGVHFSGLALIIMAEHQQWSAMLCSGLRIYDRLNINFLYRCALDNFQSITRAENRLQACTATPAKDFVNRVLDAAEINMSKVSGTLANLADDRLSTYQINAIADGRRHIAYLTQRYALWQSVAFAHIPLSMEETRSTIRSLETDMCMNVDKAIESFRSQMGYFFESRLNITSGTEEEAEKGLLESYACFSELQLQRRATVAAGARLFILEPDFLYFSSPSAGPPQ